MNIRTYWWEESGVKREYLPDFMEEVGLSRSLFRPGRLMDRLVLVWAQLKIKYITSKKYFTATFLLGQKKISIEIR